MSDGVKAVVKGVSACIIICVIQISLILWSPDTGRFWKVPIFVVGTVCYGVVIFWQIWRAGKLRASKKHLG